MENSQLLRKISPSNVIERDKEKIQDKIKVTEQENTINKRKNYYDRKYVNKTEKKTLNNDIHMKIIKGTLGIDRKQLYILKSGQGEITNKRDEVIKVTEILYTKKMYSNNNRRNGDHSEEVMNLEMPSINTS